MPTMHEIDFKIYGDDMQFVEIELDPMEAVVAEAGGMMFMDDGIDGDHLRRRLAAEQWFAWNAARRGQTSAHRGIAVHDGFSEPRLGQKEDRVRRALPGQDHPRPSCGAGW